MLTRECMHYSVIFMCSFLEGKYFIKILKKQRNFMVDTLTEVKHDIQAIKGALGSPSSKDQE
ncbi:hypothetical protein C2803_00740 [Pasteurella multocida]|nr:hypothetical protein [Pasteurella multocida]